MRATKGVRAGHQPLPPGTTVASRVSRLSGLHVRRSSVEDRHEPHRGYSAIGALDQGSGPGSLSPPVFAGANPATVDATTGAPDTLRPMADHARAVIIGGGVGGTSIAYHLAELGWTDIVLVDRAELTSGSTFHSAGLVGQLRSSVTLTRMMMYGVDLYRRLAAETGSDPSWHEVGSLRLASSKERLEELQRQAGWAKTFGLPLELIDAREAQARFPLMSTDGVLGAVWLPTDGWLDPSGLALALAAGARARGVRIHTHTRVVGIGTSGGRVTGVTVERNGERSEILADVVVNAGGMFAPEIGRMAGVTIPIIPMAHEYVFTEPIEGVHAGLPQLRDPDNLVYFREEVGGLCMGGYERRSGAVVARRRARRLQRQAARARLAAIRRDHGRGGSPRAGDRRCRHQPDDQRSGGVHAGQRVHPGRERGPRVLRGRRVLRARDRRAPAGSVGRWRPGSSRANPSSTCGRWTSAGSARSTGARRTRSRARPRSTRRTTTSTTRTRSGRPDDRCGPSPTYEHPGRLGASFGEKSGWERPNWFESNAAAG